MFSFIRRMFRPITSIGRKVGKVLGIGKKVVQQERVVERGGSLVEVGKDFVNVPVFESNFRGDKFFTGADELNRNTKAFTNRGAGFGLNENVRVPNYNPDHMDYATKYRDIWGQSIIRD